MFLIAFLGLAGVDVSFAYAIVTAAGLYFGANVYNHKVYEDNKV